MKQFTYLKQGLSMYKLGENEESIGKKLRKMTWGFAVAFLFCSLFCALFLKIYGTTFIGVTALLAVLAVSFFGLSLAGLILLREPYHLNKSEAEKALEMVLKDLRVSTVSANSSSSVVKIAEELLGTKRDTLLKVFVNKLRREEHFGETFNWPTNTEEFSKKFTRPVYISSLDPRATLNRTCEILEQVIKEVDLEIPYSFTLTTIKKMDNGTTHTEGTLEIDIIGFQVTINF